MQDPPNRPQRLLDDEEPSVFDPVGCPGDDRSPFRPAGTPPPAWADSRGRGECSENRGNGEAGPLPIPIEPPARGPEAFGTEERVRAALAVRTVRGGQPNVPQARPAQQLGALRAFVWADPPSQRWLEPMTRRRGSSRKGPPSPPFQGPRIWHRHPSLRFGAIPMVGRRRRQVSRATARRGACDTFPPATTRDRGSRPP